MITLILNYNYCLQSGHYFDEKRMLTLPDDVTVPAKMLCLWSYLGFDARKPDCCRRRPSCVFMQYNQCLGFFAHAKVQYLSFNILVSHSSWADCFQHDTGHAIVAHPKTS